MPVITVDPIDLKSLLAKPVADSQLKEILPLNKLDIESWEAGELKLEVTPDRPDLFSAEGMARQLNTWLELSPGLQQYKPKKYTVEVITSPVKLRPFVGCGVVRNVQLTDAFVRSVMRLQESLDLALGRDRKKVAIGLHDMKHIKPPITYKEIKPTEHAFIPLEMNKRFTPKQILAEHPKGKAYAHLQPGEKWPVFVDSLNQVLSLPPIINSELTKVTPKTKDLFIEITGTDKDAINSALNIMCCALADRGGQIEQVKISNGKQFELLPNLVPNKISIDPGIVKSMLAINLKNSEIKELLERAGYGVVNVGAKIEVLIPPYRADILHPVDIVEDIAVSYGYNNFVPEIPHHPSVGELNPLEEFCNSVRTLMVGLDFQEIVNYTLTSKEKHFKMMERPGQDAVELKAPLSKEWTMCRTELFPTLVENLSLNRHRRYPQQIFELGEIVSLDQKTETKTKNVRRLAAAVCHSETGLTEILSILNALKQSFAVDWSYIPLEHPSFISGRCGSIALGKERIGIFGEIHPKVLKNWQLEKPVAVFEIDLEKVYNSRI